MSDDSNTDEQTLRAMVADWAAAIRARNAAGVVAHQADGFVLYSLAPPLVSDDAGVAGLDAWFATWEGGLAVEIRDLELVIGGDAAFGHCLTRLGGIKRGGARDEIWFRQTLGFRRIGGRWRILHQHESVPFYMDGSTRAAVDLMPEGDRAGA